jgi:hypothetical protein
VRADTVDYDDEYDTDASPLDLTEDEFEAALAEVRDAAFQKGIAAGRERERGELTRMLRLATTLNGTTHAVLKAIEEGPDEPQPDADDTDLHAPTDDDLAHELLLHATEYARECSHLGSDPQPVLDALAELGSAPEELRRVLEGVAVAKGFDPNEKRDAKGEWATGGAGGGKTDAAADRERAAAELDDHEGARDTAGDLDHDDYMTDFESNPGGTADRFRADFRQMLTDKDDYAKRAAEHAGAGEAFTTAYAEHRSAFLLAGETYKDALDSAAEAWAAVENHRSEIDTLKHAELDVGDYGEPPGKPKPGAAPERVAKYESAKAEFLARRAAAFETAKEKRRGEIAEVRAKMSGPLEQYKAARRDAKAAHRELVRSGDAITALIQPLHADPMRKAVAKGFDPKRYLFEPLVIVKAWTEAQRQLHPRDDVGRFVSVAAIHAAKSDPKLAKELRKRVTDPEEKKKLEDALSGRSDIGHTVRSKQRADTAARREKVTADRDAARAIRDRLFAQHQQGQPLHADDLRALIPHLSTMSHAELSTLRTFLHGAGVSFGGEKRLAERRERVMAWAKGKAEEKPEQEEEEKLLAPEPAPTDAAPAADAPAPEAQPAKEKKPAKGKPKKAPATDVVSHEALTNDPGADHRVLAALAAAHPDADVRDHLESAANNVAREDEEPTVATRAGRVTAHRRANTIEALRLTREMALKAGKTATAEALTGVLKQFGAAEHGPAAGETAAFDGRYHEGPAGLFTGDAVKVVRPPIVWKQPDGSDHVVDKGSVEPAGAQPATRPPRAGRAWGGSNEAAPSEAEFAAASGAAPAAAPTPPPGGHGPRTANNTNTPFEQWHAFANTSLDAHYTYEGNEISRENARRLYDAGLSPEAAATQAMTRRGGASQGMMRAHEGMAAEREAPRRSRDWDARVRAS